MRTTDVTELIAVVEQIRSATQPGLSPTLLRAVVEAEASHPEDEHAALEIIRNAVATDLENETAS